MAAIVMFFMFDSFIAIAGTVEKWLCTRQGVSRTIRLVAPTKGGAPCKVFYSKRFTNDLDDSEIEADQDAGRVKPIYYSTGNGDFCVKKMDGQLDDNRDHDWTCRKV